MQVYNIIEKKEITFITTKYDGLILVSNFLFDNMKETSNRKSQL